LHSLEPSDVTVDKVLLTVRLFPHSGYHSQLQVATLNTMRLFTAFLAFSVATSATVLSVEPRSSSSIQVHPPKHASGGQPNKDNWGCNKPDFRRTVTIRKSHNDKDDISADLLAAVKKANRGGTVWLKKGEKYVIGKKLDLTFLDDFQLRLDGELKFTNDIEYWQKK
jgi:galacturan 1,4-alpha-galacturonidase